MRNPIWTVTLLVGLIWAQEMEIDVDMDMDEEHSQ
jgi:hypothetical protein